MRRQGNEVEERRIAELLARLGDHLQPPGQDELRAMAGVGAESPRLPLEAARRRAWRPLYSRWALAVAAALLLGSGFGFGLGSRGSSDGAAGTKVVGLGFLPAKGWTIVQSETRGATAARAIASNGRLHGDDEPERVPANTLAALPRDGIVIVATMSVRGDLATDVDFLPRELPLRFAAATRAPASEDPAAASPHISRYRLRAGTGAYNVDAWIYLGSAPTRDTIAAVEDQLSRLVVASEQVTLVARPLDARWGVPVQVHGSIASGKSGELVTLEWRECGPHAPLFRQVSEIRTGDGGGWSTENYLRTTTTLRARWAGHTSGEVTVRARPYVQLRRTSGRRFDVAVRALRNFLGKRVLVQRFDRRVGGWVNVRSVVLNDDSGAGGYVETSAEFRLAVPRRTLVRAVLPRSQGSPCYLAGYSSLVRT